MTNKFKLIFKLDNTYKDLFLCLKQFKNTYSQIKHF